MTMPRTKSGEPFVPKSITVRKDQADFLKENSINLSRFVQKKIDEVMGKKEAKK
jgi:post-segregation antitoxin (ccd killing protein)